MSLDVSLLIPNLSENLQNFSGIQYTTPAVLQSVPLGVQRMLPNSLLRRTLLALCLTIWRNDKSMQCIFLLKRQCPKSGCLCYTNKIILPTHLFTQLRYVVYSYSFIDSFLRLRFWCTNWRNYCLKLILLDKQDKSMKTFSENTE